MSTDTRSTPAGGTDSETSPSGDTWDVVVVGSGGAALVGAYLAAAAGLSTVVLERSPLLGGTSAYSGGALWLPGSEVQQRGGCTADSVESAREYLRAVLPAEADPDLVETFLSRSPGLVAELEAAPELEFEWLPFPEYFDAPGRCPMGRSIQPKDLPREELPEELRGLVRPTVERDRVGGPGRSRLSGGQALIGRLAAAFLRAGGEIRTDHRVVDLVTADGRVSGVVVERAGGAAGAAAGDDDEATIRIGARRGVVLAAGGFEGEQSLRDRHGVAGAADWTMAPAGASSGDVLTAAVRIGAATDLMDQAWYCPGLLHPDGAGSFTVGFRGGIMVDAGGRRYADETLPYDRFGRIMAERPDERIPSWFVFDSAEGGRLPAIAMPEGEAEDHLAAGTWVRADTIAGLAEAAGLPVDTLEATVARYNGFCEAGRDEDFGRGTDEYGDYFAGGPGASLRPVATGPFYAARFVLSDLGTKGGLVTDAAARVVDGAGEPIAGLYACGNTAASITRDVYPGPGAPLGTGMVFASLAVEDMARAAASSRLP